MRSVDVLKAQIEPFFDQESSQFTAFPQNQQEVARKWRLALQEYLLGNIPVSTTLVASLDTFEGIMLTVSIGTGIQNFPQAFVSQAALLASGMAPAFTGTPPVGPPVFAPVYTLGLNNGSNADCLELLCNIIHAWYSTGIAVQAGTGATINWQ